MNRYAGMKPAPASRRSLLLAFLIAASAVSLVSCSRSKTVPESQTTTDSTTTVTRTRTVRVSHIDLGRGLSSDRRVVTTDQPFTPGDTVYAAVVLTGPVPASQVTARWTAADGAVVAEETQAVAASDAEEVVQFHMAKPAGLPPGEYRVDVLVDGQVVSTKNFMIAAP